ncbi:hypothetical protein NLO85_28210, partial [Pseudomonas savastanoi]
RKTERKTRSTHTASDRFQKNSAMCLANYGLPPLRGKLIGASLVVRIDAIWLSTEPMDTRAGMSNALARLPT